MTTRALQPLGVLAGLSAAVILCLAAIFLDDSAWGLIWFAYPVVGAGVLLRRPTNRIGWLMVATGGMFAGSIVATAKVADGTLASPTTELLVVAFGGLGFLLLVAILVCFPSGSPRTRWDRWVLGLMTLAGVTIVSAYLTSDAPLNVTKRPNPWAVPALGAFDSFMIGPGFYLVIVLMVAGIVGMVRRWRRTAGIERMQYRWLLLGTAVAAFTLTVATLFISGPSAPILIGIAAGMSCIPIAIGVAVLRYRLYEIDRVISRTASYAIVTGLLLGTYSVIVTSVTRLLPDSSTLAVAAATLAAAALARPLFRRVQLVVDRRFNRTRYDAQHTVETFGERLRNEVDAELVSDDLIGVVRQTLQPQGAALWLREES